MPPTQIKTVCANFSARAFRLFNGKHFIRAAPNLFVHVWGGPPLYEELNDSPPHHPKKGTNRPRTSL